MAIEETLTPEQLREKHKDVFENPAIQKVIQFARKGDTASLGDQSPEANKYATNDEAYSQKSKAILPHLLKYLD